MSKPNDTMQDPQDVNMSQEQVPEPAASSDSPGKQLREARLAKGLSQKDVADRLHLRPSSIIAIENDAKEEGVSVTFTKGYVRLYAKLMQLDGDALMNEYGQLHSKTEQPAKLQSFSRQLTREASDSRWNLVTIVVVILVLGSVIGWWVQQSGTFDNPVSNTIDNLFNEDSAEGNSGSREVEITLGSNEEEQEPPAAIFNEEEFVPESPNPQPIVQQVDNAITSDTSNSLDEQVNSLDDELTNELNNSSVAEQAEQSVDEIGNDTEEQLQSALDGSPASSPAQAELNANGYSVNGDGTVDLVFTFSEDCWVSVKDANGETMAIGVKTKGRVMEVSGLPPIDIILGTPQEVAINFGGKDVDMSVHPAGRSANFTLSL